MSNILLDFGNILLEIGNILLKIGNILLDQYIGNILPEKYNIDIDIDIAIFEKPILILILILPISIYCCNILLSNILICIPDRTQQIYFYCSLGTINCSRSKMIFLILQQIILNLYVVQHYLACLFHCFSIIGETIESSVSIAGLVIKKIML